MDDSAEELLSSELEDDHYASCSSSTKKGRKSQLPLADPILVETKNETGFHKSTRLCLERIREAMLHHRWEEAAEYMACYAQKLEDTSVVDMVHDREAIWRISTEILHHHPNSKMEDYNTIYERMKHSGVKHYLMISLEHAFHLMLHGQIEEAKRHLTFAESWRYGKTTEAQDQDIKLIQAYRSLLDYIIWCDKKLVRTNNAHTDLSENQEMKDYYRQASVNLKEILKNPGVWDPFILRYVEMLEFYGDHEEAGEVLKNYAFDSSFPPNPNAHVYLYQFLQRRSAPMEKLIKVLRSLHSLVPSHELMLEYSSLLLQSENQEQSALGVVLDMLDYSCWKKNLDVWKRLKEIIDKLQSHDDWRNDVSTKMAARKDWWPALHFARFHASEDAQEYPELLEVKASLIGTLCPGQTFTYADVGAMQTQDRDITASRLGSNPGPESS